MQLGEIIDASEIDALSSASTTKTYTVGEIIVKEGDRGDNFYMIEEGTVDVFKAASGLKAISSMSVGDFFGEKALLADDIRTATCVGETYDTICVCTVI